jgi:2-desacetyl-2-hydroxyethyl bacteriochlorophyllide A dehydrogenase
MAHNEIPKTGVQVVVKPDNRVTAENFQVRPPARGEVLVETVSTLISAGTELGSQEQKRTHDFTPGYSNAGRIIALGEGVEGYQVGDRVLSLGRHASYVTVSAAPPSLAKIPDDVSFDEGAFGVLGSVSMHGVRKARIELGEFAAITGMGLVGQLALQLAAGTGCELLIAIDLSDFRLSTAQAAGATHILNPGRCDLRQEVQRITEGRGLDVIIEASGYPELLPIAFDMARIGGRIMALGSIWHRKVEVDFMPFHEKELTLAGCHQPKCPTVATPAFPWTQQYNRRQILKLIARGELNVQRLITHRLPYMEAGEAYRLLREAREESLGIILTWGNDA